MARWDHSDSDPARQPTVWSDFDAAEYADRNFGHGIVPEDRAISRAFFQALSEYGVGHGDLRTGVIHFAGVNRIPELWLMRLGIETTSIVYAGNESEIQFRQAMHDPQGDGRVHYFDPDGNPHTFQTRDIWEKFVDVVDDAAQPYYPGFFDDDPLQRDITVQVGDVFDFTPDQFRGEPSEAEDRAPGAAAGEFPRADGRQKADIAVEAFGADSAFLDSRAESAGLSPDERWAVPPEQLDRRWAALDCLIDSADKIAVSGLALNDGQGWLAGEARFPNTAYSREAVIAYASAHPRVAQLRLFESRTGEVAFSDSTRHCRLGRSRSGRQARRTPVQGRPGWAKPVAVNGPGNRPRTGDLPNKTSDLLRGSHYSHSR